MTPESELSVLVDCWCEYLVALGGKSAATTSSYREMALGFIESLAARRPEDITFENLEAWIKRLYASGYATSSRSLAISAMRSFCRYLGAKGLIASNPALAIERPKIRVEEKPTLTREEIERLVYDGSSQSVPADVVELRNRTIWWIMYICGLRVSEPGGIRADSLRWHEQAGGRVFSLVVSGKGGREDRMPLDPDGSRLLAVWLEAKATAPAMASSPWLFPAARGGRLSGSRVYSAFKARLKAAGIRPNGRRLTPHVLRHSLATHLLEVGWNPKEVQERMRHGSLATTGIYLHADRDKESRRLARQHPVRSAKAKRAPHAGRAAIALLQDLKNL